MPQIWLVLAVSAVSILNFAGCGESQQQDSAKAKKEQAVPVETVKVQSQDLKETVGGIGTLQSRQTVDIQPEVAGIIEEIHFEEGKIVEKGQLLFTIDDEKLQHQLEAKKSALEAAEARLINAQRTYERNKDLVKQDLVSEEVFDQNKTNVEQASAQVKRLKSENQLIEEQINDKTILAPITGMISDTEIDTGDFVDVGEHLALLYETSSLEISFNLPERYIGKVREGLPVTVTVVAYPGKKFKGKVDFISPAIGEETRDFKVKAIIGNSENLLKPGGFGRATVTLELLEKRPVIPEEALVSVQEGYKVFVVKDGVAHERDVRIGLREPGKVEIREGLKIGDKVVRTGHMRLTDGTKVKEAGGQNSQANTSPAGSANLGSAVRDLTSGKEDDSK